jgi:hypothetical protein
MCANRCALLLLAISSGPLVLRRQARPIDPLAAKATSGIGAQRTHGGTEQKALTCSPRLLQAFGASFAREVSVAVHPFCYIRQRTGPKTPASTMMTNQISRTT